MTQQDIMGKLLSSWKRNQMTLSVTFRSNNFEVLLEKENAGNL